MLSLKRREGRLLLAQANHAMISPFAFFSWLYETHPVDFARRFLGGLGATVGDAGRVLRAFWRKVPADDPRKIHLVNDFMKREDITTPRQFWSRAVPIAFHGDGLPLSRTVFLCRSS